MSITEKEHEEFCKAKPTKEHEWLKKLAGEWSFEGEADMGPDKPKMKSEGAETVRALGELWMVAEGWMKGHDGEEHKTMMTVGYDPKTNRYPGTWVGSMMTHMWVYDGEMNAAGNVLTLNAVGPSFSDPKKTAKYQDIIEIVSDNERLLKSQFQTETGEWVHFMTARYKRKK